MLGALVVALSSVPAPAGPPPELRRGLEAFEKGEMRKAEAHLRKALAGKLSDPQRARAFLHLGIVEANRQATAEARRFFGAALEHDPLVAPDRDRVPPGILRLFEKVRGAVRGTLRVATFERNAQVLVDGRRRGTTPLALRLPVGPHRVRMLSADGNRHTPERRVVIRAGQTTEVKEALQVRMGKLRLELNTEGVVATPAGTLGSGRSVSAPIEAGLRRLTVRAPGFYPSSHEVQVRPEETVTLRVRLTRMPPWYARRRVWGWISVGISAGALVTGLLVGRSATSAESAIRSGQDNATLDYDRFRVLQEAVSSNSRWANVFLGIAGAGAIGGAILLVVGDRDKPATGAWRVIPTPRGLAVSARF